MVIALTRINLNKRKCDTVPHLHIFISNGRKAMKSNDKELILSATDSGINFSTKY